LSNDKTFGARQARTDQLKAPAAAPRIDGVVSKPRRPPKDPCFVKPDLAWKAHYSVGNALLDQQHRDVLATCARLAAHIDDNSDSGLNRIHGILHELTGCMETHFRTEEMLLTQHSYSNLAEHKREHDDFLARFADVLYAATIGVIDKAFLGQLLPEWWVRHLLEVDLSYRPFLENRPDSANPTIDD
jgi:hemerythrin